MAPGTAPECPPLFHMLGDVSNSQNNVFEAAAVRAIILVRIADIRAQLPPTGVIRGRPVARSEAVPSSGDYRRPFTAEAQARARVSPCGICGEQSGNGTGFSPCCSGFSCQYHVTVAIHAHWGDEQ
jgi:hypothetical protein